MRETRSLFLVALLVLCIPMALPAQESTTPPPTNETPPPEEEKKPEAVPITELSSRLAAAQLRLREIEESASQVKEAAAILEAIASFGETLEERQAQFESRPLESYTLKALEEMKVSWRTMGGEVTGWEKLIAARLAQLDGFDKEIEVMRTTWQETSQDPRAADYPLEITEQIAQLLAEFEVADAAVSKRTEVVLSKQKLVTGFRVDINESIKQIETVAEEKRGSLFTLDSPPVWEVLAGDTTGISVVEQTSGKEERRSLGESALAFFLQYAGRVTIHILLTIALGLLLWRMRRRAFTFETEDVDLQNALRILKRPFAAAILLLWMTPGRTYDHAPFVIFELMAVVVLAAAAILVRAMVPKQVLRYVYAVFAIGVLEHLNTVITTNTVTHRLNTAGITMLVLALVVFWNVRGSARANLPSGWSSYTWVLRPFAWLLAGALMALVIGASALGELCSYGLIYTIFYGVAIFVTVRTFEASLLLLLRVHGDRFPRFVSHHRKLVGRRIVAAVRLAAVAWWLFASLEEFRLFQPVWHEITETVVREWTVGQVSFSVAGILLFFVVLWVASLLSRFIRFVLQEDVLPRLPIRRGLPNTILLMVNYGIMALGIIIALASLGLETSQFTVIAGALGVGVGFGLQNLVNNFVSGLILMFERPVQIGDTVEVGNLTGSVKRIGIRASVIRTFSGSEVIVPNGDLVSGQVINWTLSDQNRRLELYVGVKYGSDPNRVIEVLMKAIEGNTRLMQDPEPYVVFLGFGDSSLDFELRAWTNDPVWWILGGEIKIQMYEALTEAGIEIPFPQRDLHLRSVDPDAADTLKKGRTDD